MADEILLNAGEQKSIARSLIDWLNQNCPAKPTNIYIEYQYLDENTGISLNSNSGAIVLSQYVDGSYTGFYPFSIYYRCSPDSTDTRLSSSDILDEIGSWITNCEILGTEYPTVEEGIEITNIKQVTTTVLAKRFENGTEDYMATFELYYDRV